jgi:hypothetical protein
MLCVPALSNGTVRLAVLLMLLAATSVIGAWLAPSTLKVTVPAGAPSGVPLAVFVTVTAKLADWPKVIGFSEEETVVEVEIPLTSCPPESEPVLLLKSVLPL